MITHSGKYIEELHHLSITVDRIDRKMDDLSHRTAVSEARQSTHEAICVEREASVTKFYNEMVKKTEKFDAEFDAYRIFSNEDRNRIRDEMYRTVNNLLWKLVGAMVVIIGATTTILVNLVEKGIIH